MHLQLQPAMHDFARDMAAQLRSGAPLFGTGGVFTPLIKTTLELMLEGEMEEHLTGEQRKRGNRRNGYQQPKILKTAYGSVEIVVPRDRAGTFQPQLIRKRETLLTESLEGLTLSLYGQGFSMQDISSHMQDIYGVPISTASLSHITNKILPEIKAWQNRPLEPLYCIVWLDAMRFKVMEGGQFVSKCVYNVLGINVEGKKELLGMYVAGSEGASFWVSVLSSLQERGVQDILIACTDNLKGFPEAIQSVFPDTEVQLCIVHQVRNSLKSVSNSDKPGFIHDMRLVYRSSTEEEGRDQLALLKAKWLHKYPVAIRSWENNWVHLSAFYKYPPAIRSLIYTTNTIESFHKQVRRVTKNKGAWESDTALTKLIYLAALKIQHRWNHTRKDWSPILSQLTRLYEDRVRRFLKPA